MRIAVLVQCHKNPNQINKIIEALSHECIDIYVHVDAKSDIIHSIGRSQKVIILPDSKRVDVKWGTISQVEASLNLLSFAVDCGSYDYYWLISGQDFPIKKASEIADFFAGNRNKCFVNLFCSKNNGLDKSNNYDKRNQIVFKDWMFRNGIVYRLVRRAWVEITGGYNRTFNWAKRQNNTGSDFFFGSSWWCICNGFANYVIDYVNNHQEYYSFFRKTSCPDESFFQTLLMNSPFRHERLDYLHYVDWSTKKNNPKVLTIKDLNAIIKSDKLMARKFDESVDREIIEELEKRL